MQLNLRYLALGTTDGTLIALGIVTATRGLTSLHLTLYLSAIVARLLISRSRSNIRQSTTYDWRT